MPGCTLAGPPVATAEGLLTAVACWPIMATAIALERACTLPVTLTTFSQARIYLAVTRSRTAMPLVGVNISPGANFLNQAVT